MPGEEEIEVAAARETASNLLKAIADLKWRGYQSRIWFPMLYPHRITLDLLEAVRSPPQLLKLEMNFAPFHPQGKWHARIAKETNLELLFQRDDDYVLFKLAVMK